MHTLRYTNTEYWVVLSMWATCPESLCEWHDRESNIWPLITNRRRSHALAWRPTQAGITASDPQTSHCPTDELTSGGSQTWLAVRCRAMLYSLSNAATASTVCAAWRRRPRRQPVERSLTAAPWQKCFLYTARFTHVIYFLSPAFFRYFRVDIRCA